MKLTNKHKYTRTRIQINGNVYTERQHMVYALSRNACPNVNVRFAFCFRWFIETVARFNEIMNFCCAMRRSWNFQMTKVLHYVAHISCFCSLVIYQNAIIGERMGLKRGRYWIIIWFYEWEIWRWNRNVNNDFRIKSVEQNSTLTTYPPKCFRAKSLLSNWPSVLFISQIRLYVSIVVVN